MSDPPLLRVVQTRSTLRPDALERNMRIAVAHVDDDVPFAGYIELLTAQEPALAGRPDDAEGWFGRAQAKFPAWSERDPQTRWCIRLESLCWYQHGLRAARGEATRGMFLAGLMLKAGAGVGPASGYYR
jgi:hypothetical protein